MGKILCDTCLQPMERTSKHHTKIWVVYSYWCATCEKYKRVRRKVEDVREV